MMVLIALLKASPFFMLRRLSKGQMIEMLGQATTRRYLLVVCFL